MIERAVASSRPEERDQGDLAVEAAAKESQLANGQSADAGTENKEEQPKIARPRPKLTTITQVTLIIFSGMVVLYFGRPVIMPVVFSMVAATALSPIMRWLGKCHVPPALGAAIVLGVFAGAVGFGAARLAAPAMDWIGETPDHMTQLRQRVHTLFRPAARISKAAAAVNNLGNSDEEKTQAVQVRDGPGTARVINWTGGLFASVGETLVLLYLLLASGDLFLQKIVSISATFHDKRRAVEISHEIEGNITHYLFTVSLINICLGCLVGGGLYFLGVPNAAMWGVLAAVLNYVPYFGPCVGIIVLAVMGLVTFDTLPRALLPPLWYALVHGTESNFITPILLGRRFTLNPVIIFISLIFWTWLWGVAGALLSVPILVAVKVICDHVKPLEPISEFLVS
jgi:predicted PurR-regulated permease PerM